MKKQIRVRLAPSPTGLFHIGTARTGLFNYLFAKKNKGKFILRIEDTDEKRSTKEYEKDILEGLSWLGINADEGVVEFQKQKGDYRPYYQSQRLSIYKKYLDKLLEIDAAYKKDGAIWFNLDAYKSDKIIYRDLIIGELKFNKDNFNNFPICKKNGTPLYIFAAAIDDYEMKISHIIRGDDHINSTPQQIMILDVLGLEKPKYAHIPMILNRDRSKMSKRKNPVSVSKDFKANGYLPEAMINYIALLGWNPKNEQEFFSLEKLSEIFSLKNINKSGAIFDIEKLKYFNNYYIKNENNKSLTKLLKIKDDKLNKRILEIVKNRLSTLEDFPKLAECFYKVKPYNGKSLIFKKSNQSNTIKGLKNLSEKLKQMKKSKWDQVDAINNKILETVKENNLTNGDVFWPVRYALSGQDKSPQPAEIAWVIGKQETLKRLESAIAKLN